MTGRGLVAISKNKYLILEKALVEEYGEEGAKGFLKVFKEVTGFDETLPDKKAEYNKKYYDSLKDKDMQAEGRMLLGKIVGRMLKNGEVKVE